MPNQRVFRGQRAPIAMNEETLETHVRDFNIAAAADLKPVFSQALLYLFSLANVHQRATVIKLVNSLALRKRIDLIAGK